jgi:putative DNA primase/helicase
MAERMVRHVGALRDKQFAVVKDSKGIRWRKGIRLREQGMFGAVDGGPSELEREQPQPSVEEDDDLP